MPNPIQHAKDRNRFELEIDGSVAFVDYLDDGQTLALTHTEVPEALRGRGLAALLVQHALDYARQNRRKVDPQCSYVAKFIDQHPEYADLRKDGA